MNKFLPLPHPKIHGLVRVPVYRDIPPLYTVWLTEDFTRVFTDKSLPDYIRTKIVIADAGYEDLPNYLGNPIKSNEVSVVDLFMYRGTYGLQDSGWKYNSNYYIVVLNKVEFNTLLGKESKDGNA